MPIHRLLMLPLILVHVEVAEASFGKHLPLALTPRHSLATAHAHPHELAIRSHAEPHRHELALRAPISSWNWLNLGERRHTVKEITNTVHGYLRIASELDFAQEFYVASNPSQYQSFAEDYRRDSLAPEERHRIAEVLTLGNSHEIDSAFAEIRAGISGRMVKNLISTDRGIWPTSANEEHIEWRITKLRELIAQFNVQAKPELLAGIPPEFHARSIQSKRLGAALRVYADSSKFPARNQSLFIPSERIEAELIALSAPIEDAEGLLDRTGSPMWIEVEGFRVMRAEIESRLKQVHENLLNRPARQAVLEARQRVLGGIPLLVRQFPGIEFNAEKLADALLLSDQPTRNALYQRTFELAMQALRAQLGLVHSLDRYGRYGDGSYPGKDIWWSGGSKHIESEASIKAQMHALVDAVKQLNIESAKSPLAALLQRDPADRESYLHEPSTDVRDYQALLRRRPATGGEPERAWLLEGYHFLTSFAARDSKIHEIVAYGDQQYLQGLAQYYEARYEQVQK